MIEIDNLIKSYGQLDVIKGINMNVEKGEVITSPFSTFMLMPLITSN